MAGDIGTAGLCLPVTEWLPQCQQPDNATDTVNADATVNTQLQLLFVLEQLIQQQFVLQQLQQ